MKANLSLLTLTVLLLASPILLSQVPKTQAVEAAAKPSLNLTEPEKLKLENLTLKRNNLFLREQQVINAQFGDEEKAFNLENQNFINHVCTDHKLSLDKCDFNEQKGELKEKAR